MACKISFNCVISLVAKVFCMVVLIGQSVALDFFIIRLDTEASDAGRYIWIGLDAIVAVVWIIALALSFRFFRLPSHRKVPTEGFTGKQIVKIALKELPFAYSSWLLYAIVLVAKINRMFASFAVNLTRSNETRLTNTSLKIILSMAGVLFALLAYSHQDEAHNSKYKLLIEKLGRAASIDVLDSVMLLDILFTVHNGLDVSPTLSRIVRAFSSICILLPVFPLIALRITGISSSLSEKTQKIFPKVMVINTALYLFLVNIPLFSIRLYLWVNHDVDITTWLTKNIMAIGKGVLDMYRELSAWRREVLKEEHSKEEAVQMEPFPV